MTLEFKGNRCLYINKKNIYINGKYISVSRDAAFWLLKWREAWTVQSFAGGFTLWVVFLFFFCSDAGKQLHFKQEALSERSASPNNSKQVWKQSSSVEEGADNYVWLKQSLCEK